MGTKKARIYFFQEDIHFSLKNKLRYKQWIAAIGMAEGVPIGSLSFIFCSDDYLLTINTAYLGKDDLTDVIAFDLKSEEELVSGEVYISIDRVRENALQFGSSFDQELKRVMAHGTLHLLGYNDKTKSGKSNMNAKEDCYIAEYEVLS
jgi:probable rRNA maturation factor